MTPSLTKSILFSVSIVILAISVLPAAAQISPIDDRDCSRLGFNRAHCDEVPTDRDVNRLILRVVNWFMSVIGIAAVVALIWGGTTYIISRGEEQEVQKAKSIIIYALIGLLVVGFSAVIVNFVLAPIVR